MLSTGKTELSEERRNLEETVLVWFNGVAAKISSDEHSEAETSCSIFAPGSKSGNETSALYHLMLDVGSGAFKSLEDGIHDVNAREKPLHAEAIPDAILLSHGHVDHIADLAKIATKLRDSSFSTAKAIQVYCSEQCQNQIRKAFPTLLNPDSPLRFSTIAPGEKITVGPFRVLALRANHDSDREKGESLVFVINQEGTKIVSGWDFHSLGDADESALWNPALLILGTESYNPHPLVTGMISVTDAFNLARRWNAKEVFLLHYNGIADIEDGKNQWFMGPTKPMSLDELQKMVDKTLGITGVEGKFRITVAKQGMIWSSKEYHDRVREYYAGSRQYSGEDMDQTKLGHHLEIEALDKYLLKFDSLDAGRKLRLTVEDKIKSFEPEFEAPVRNDKGTVLKAYAIRGMFAKGPEMHLTVTENSSTGYPEMPDNISLELIISKGKKHLFRDTIPIMKQDANRLIDYINENFKVSKQALAARAE